MAKAKMLNVYLEREWSGHKVGETVTVEDYTAESMVRKGYGYIVKEQRPAPPKVETADAPPAAENAMSNPILSTKAQVIIDAQAHGEKDENKKKGKTKSSE